MTTTFEEAKLCPKCGKPGEDVRVFDRKNSMGKPVTVHTIYCRVELCPWYNTSWLVQVNEDGTIPDPYSQLGPKQYPKLSEESVTRVQEAIQTQLDQETKPGGSEVRNPYG